jgi:hypothetical protein
MIDIYDSTTDEILFTNVSFEEIGKKLWSEKHEARVMGLRRIIGMSLLSGKPKACKGFYAKYSEMNMK